MNGELRSRLRESYNRKAHERDGRTLQTWKIEERRTFLRPLQQEQKRSLLEIGAGTGLGAKFFWMETTLNCISSLSSYGTEARSVQWDYEAGGPTT